MMRMRETADVYVSHYDKETPQIEVKSFYTLEML